ncbi:M20/M25/M40 family metallo-hydrolase [Nocardiopsis sp. CNT312]|uniref:M20/M25/M40 family metallo-hydrolase n=1 Tax=Nocardiopsis sp. CNT312 TaxID=1137268 RepID=UPI00048C2187|nr:M20/M25/M40 family metallo-hydrolase [Nocardiopsis sp. CNT312]
MSVRLDRSDHDLLLRLMELPTAGPLETGPEGPEPRLYEAQDLYARAAAGLGFRTVHLAPASPGDLDRPDVPLPVRDAARDAPGFLECQPSAVLRLGPEAPAERTVMFNVHLDTVAGLPPVGFDGTVFRGRGAVDAKGPAVALLAGVRAARKRRPALGRDVAVLVQAVAGEEGGAMGVLGTRPLVERGHTGRLNVFCEPTRTRFLTRSTASMTARISVRGADAVDDRPHTGHNASVLLGFLAQHLGRSLDAHAATGAVCVAGLHTGRLHNRVYGTGDLLLNLSYGRAEAGPALEEAVERAFDQGLEAFTADFTGTALFDRTAADARGLARLEWLKRGLPVLDDRDPWGRALLRRAGIAPWPDGETPFTCDALWMAHAAGACTVVLGPGHLADNHAHAEGEYVRADQLDGFADAVARLLTVCTDDMMGRP